MPVPFLAPVPEDQVTQARRRLDLQAPTLDETVEDAVEALVEAGAIPRDRWRQLAHVLYCRAIYTTHIEPLEKHLTFQEIANHLSERGVPRFRGASDWSAAAISDIRAVLAAPSNEISLPDP
jgi:hypothetical protein